MAFQIKDDMLDLLPADDKIGKPIGHDLESGLINLPTILLLQKDFPEKAEIVSRIRARFPNGKEDFDFIIPFITQDEIVGACEDTILYHIDAAKDILDGFADNATRDLLYQTADYIYERSI